ncbi:MAG TPA: helix-turn-helix transcriptional regulator [Actinophytocola sp.]|nr:helix-turn-helix transcriptional regulator [Actinophytocola sp.]
MARRDDIRFGQVLRQLLNDRFRNRRKDFAKAIHVSESALSQYVRGKATPSLAVLTAIARELDVTLDYLVFGTEPDPPAPNYGNLVTHVEEAITRAQAKSVTLRDFVGRVGATLADEIETTAKRVLAETETSLGAGLAAAQVRELEGISKQIRIATVDLDLDVDNLLLQDDSATRQPGEAQNEVVSAPFNSVIVHNVKQRSEYLYVVPEGQEWRRKASRLREDVAAAGGLTTAFTDRYLKFYTSRRALTPSYVVYEVDPGRLKPKSERLLDQIADYVDEYHFVALVEPSSKASQYYPLIDAKHVQRIVTDHDQIVAHSPRLVFN